MIGRRRLVLVDSAEALLQPLEVLLNSESQLRAALSSIGIDDEVTRSADDDLVLACADCHQQRDRPFKIRVGDQGEFGVADIGLEVKKRRSVCPGQD